MLQAPTMKILMSVRLTMPTMGEEQIRHFEALVLSSTWIDEREVHTMKE